ncbi:hypothetical protein KO465_06210 [Candidatus Micrarchaeota archaeon]|jgi:hypothetical protein|nr:hypothetical protein [Candidatus Micrarchaeota archaeon]
MTKNFTLKPIQKLCKIATGNQIRRLGQFLVKTWSGSLIKGGQSSGKMRVKTLRQRFGVVSVVLELFQARSVENQGGQKVSNNGTDLENFQAKQGVQKVDKNGMKRVHQRFTETSPDFEGLSLGRCRQSDGKMSAGFYPSFVLFPLVDNDIWKSPIQFAIPSSYLYVVVLKEPDL